MIRNLLLFFIRERLLRCKDLLHSLNYRRNMKLNYLIKIIIYGNNSKIIVIFYKIVKDYL